MEKTLKAEILKTAEQYERRAAWERKRAEQATDGSNIQNEIMRACKFNEGRAKAMREALEIIEKYVG